MTKAFNNNDCDYGMWAVFMGEDDDSLFRVCISTGLILFCVVACLLFKCMFVNQINIMVV